MKPEPVRHPLLELTSVRTKEFLREPEALFWVFAFPILMALVLGFAFRSKPPEQIPVGVVQGPAARQRVAALAKSPALLPRVVSESEGREALRRGTISLLVSADTTPVYRFDPTRPESRTARVEADGALQTAAGRRDVLQAREEHVREQGSRYIDFLIPGLLGMNLMGTGMWSMGFTIANARMRKLLKRMVATPMRKTHYFFAHFLSRLVWLVLEVVILIAFGWLVFDVRVHGSIALLAFLSLLGGFMFSGLGLLVASRARTIEAVSGLMNVVMMPMWLCSGVFFSYERFPDSIKPLIRALPLTALNDALRAVVNDSATAAQIAPQMLVLMVWAIITYSIGLKIFRWQ